MNASDGDRSEWERPLQFWHQFFGLTGSELVTPGLYVVPHAALLDYHGAWIFEHQGARVVSLPLPLLEELGERANAWLTHSTPTAVALSPVFGDRIDRVIGPAYHGFLTFQEFTPHALPGVREVTPADEAAVTRLQEAAGETAWEYAGIDPASPSPRFGAWVDGCLISIAQNEVLAPGVVAPGVVTHPYFRGRGGGKSTVSAAAAHALRRDELVLYQTLVSNGPAMAIARALGFKECGVHTAVRFR